ncbi:TPA: M48 family metallopeptidase [Bacillus cereus]
MSLNKHIISYGERQIEFAIRYSSRKTLAINVLPDMTVEVVAPHNTENNVIYEKVRKKARWILKQIIFFQQYHPKTPERKYVSGETHRYLGRQYRLRVIQGEYEKVNLIHGYITIKTRNPMCAKNTQKLLENWFLTRAKIKYKERLDYCITQFPNHLKVIPAGMTIRKMTNRWGSMTMNGRIILNRRLIQAPTPCIDYVIIHELCHLIYSHHGPEFWRLLSKVLPEWEKRKNKLEEVMV